MTTAGRGAADGMARGMTGGAVVDLGVHEPYDAPGVFAFLAARAVPGVEVAHLAGDRLTYARTLRTRSGTGTLGVSARAAGAGWRLEVQVDTSGGAQESELVDAARRLLDLDHDAIAADAALARDPLLSLAVRDVPGIRVPGSVDAAELLVRAVVGQQISVAAARTHLSRLVQAGGSAYDARVPGLDRLFPTPTQIAEVVPDPVPGTAPDPQRPLRLPGRSTSAVLAAVRDLDSGELVISSATDPVRLRESLVRRPSIGPWTAAYVAMRVLGDPDAWLSTDVALVAGARSLGMLPAHLSTREAHRVLARRAESWAPWRSYAVMHLWQAAARASSDAAGSRLRR